MTRRSLLGMGALLCLFAILAVPASASVNGAGITGSASNQIDPGLKDELWNIHVQHRLDIFNRNVQAADDAMEALEEYGYETSELSTILADISGKEGALTGALNARDREALREVNAELLHLWKDYRFEMRQLLKEG